MRKLTKTLAAVTLMAPMGAHPLGIGDIELHSALNERLKAEIFLNLSEGESLGDVQVQLASPEKFKEVGIPRSYFLSKISFEPVIKPDGSVVIQLSSNGVVKEPFLDFLLEVSWPKGSLYREFSVLVDPPVTYQQPVVPVVQAPVRQQAISKPKPSRPAAVTSPAPARPRAPQYQDLQNADQYTVQRNDTLWEIAQRVKDSDVSVEQMMIALYDTNPQAFNNNVNSLKSGRTLQVPNRSVVLRISRLEAKSEFNRQTKVWRGEVAPPRSTPTDISSGSNRITLVAPTDTEVMEQEIVSPGAVEIDREEMSSPSGTRQPSSAGTAQDGAMNERMAKLEQQLQLMQKMLTMRDEQLALLQQQLEDKDKQPQTGQQTKPAEAAAVTKPGTSGKSKPAAGQIDKPVLDKSKQADSEQQQTSDKLKAGATAQQQAKQPETVEKPATTAKPKPKPRPKIEPKPVTKTVSSDSDPYSGYYMIFGAVGLTLLGLLGWLLWRNKMLDDEDSTESMFAASSEIILPEEDQELTIPVIDDESTYDVGTVGESSFLSEFIPSDFDAFDTEQAEVDPISEADVYLAYGRYQQAEELMRQAIEDHPDRDECKLKLLEIFYSNEDADSYVTYATELVEQGKKDEVVFWSKVAEMGNEIAPDADIFSVDQGDDNLSAGAIESQGTTAHTSIESVNVDDMGLDFDLSELSSAAGQQAASTGDEEDISGSLESIEQLDDSLDLNATPATFEQSGSQENEGQPENPDNGSELEFNFDQEDTITNNSDLNPENTESSDNLFEDFDFTSESSNTDSQSDTSGSLDFDFDIDQLTDEEDKQSSGSGSNIYDLNDMDEFDTKIDLAKAYIDMGDPEAAKVIVEEVMQKGNKEQQQEAKQLLDTML